MTQPAHAAWTSTPASEEDLAAELLERFRGKAAWRAAQPNAGALASKIVKPLLPPTLSMGLADLKAQWRAIVGDKLASVTEPEKISHGEGGRTLTVRVAGPAAPFVQHQTALLLERCNVAGAALSGIALKQAPLSRPRASNVRPLPAPLAADAEAALSIACGSVGDPALKEALMRLGRALAR